MATATAADGQVGAHAIIGQAVNLRKVSIDVDRRIDTVAVSVHGDLGCRIFPGACSVTARAEGPVERFIPEDER